MLAKELAGHSLGRRFVRDRFRTVLTKLGDLAMIVRARPGAALAIESIFLVYVEQCLETARDSHFANRETGRLNHRRPASCDSRWFADGGVAVGGGVGAGRRGRLVRVR